MTLLHGGLRHYCHPCSRAVYPETIGTDDPDPSFRHPLQFPFSLNRLGNSRFTEPGGENLRNFYAFLNALLQYLGKSHG
jgi:hypothetical protein